MNFAITDAGTKYFAISTVSLFPSSFRTTRCDIFLLMIPSRHFRLASKTPDPEFPVVATSLMTVSNFRTLIGSNFGESICDRAVPSGTTVMTRSPGQGGSSQSGLRRSDKRSGSRPSSTDKRVMSMVSKSPAFTTFVGNSWPPIETFGRVSQV